MAFPAFTSSLLCIRSILLFNRAGVRDTEVRCCVLTAPNTQLRDQSCTSNHLGSWHEQRSACPAALLRQMAPSHCCRPFPPWPAAATLPPCRSSTAGWTGSCPRGPRTRCWCTPRAHAGGAEVQDALRGAAVQRASGAQLWLGPPRQRAAAPPPGQHVAAPPWRLALLDPEREVCSGYSHHPTAARRTRACP